eukprot:gene12526-6349_t
MKALNIKIVLESLKNNIYPFKDDINLLMLKIASEYKISLSEFNDEEIDKLKKYIDFFSYCIDEIYFN